MVVKAYQYRIYPTKEQEVFLAKQFGCSRFVYNHFLAERIENYNKSKIKSTYNKDCKKLTELKKKEEFSWLKETNSQTLQSALDNLQTAYNRFFKGLAEFPKFHKRRNEQCIKIPENFCIEGNKLCIPKLNTGIEILLHRPIGVGKQLSCFIRKTTTDKYFVSIHVEEDLKPLPKVDGMVGIDLGIKSLIVTSDGEIIDNPKYYYKYEKKIAYYSRQLAKKKPGSNNKNKERKKLSRVHEVIGNKRKDYIHKVTRRLINENQIIVAENLAVKNMVQNHCLAKAISDSAWGEITRQINYKADWYLRTYFEIDRYFASSKTCNGCKAVLEDLTLDVRKWRCAYCGLEHDRDHNAARNILEEGLRKLGLWNVILQQKLVEALRKYLGR